MVKKIQFTNAIEFGTERTGLCLEGTVPVSTAVCSFGQSALTSLFRLAIHSTRNVSTKHGNHLGTEGTTSIPEQVHISDFDVRPYSTCSF
jgi:hypothetical protein